ncbi:MAG: hypothetical protein ND866_21305 [Pyrinomonadaceae bacterium]|nr:hypothetical protein [Pyrinomonadaceae bacterium]
MTKAQDGAAIVGVFLRVDTLASQKQGDHERSELRKRLAATECRPYNVTFQKVISGGG